MAENELTPQEAVRTHGQRKKEYITSLFDRVAPGYDFLNLLISLGGTSRWRRKALKFVDFSKIEKMLDVGTGTGLIPQLIERKHPKVSIDAMDISENMLNIARKKLSKTNLFTGDATLLELEDNSYDLVTSAYVLRNFHDRQKALSEMLRVLKPGGSLLILDSFAPIGNPVLRLAMKIWLSGIVPIITLPFRHVSDYRYLASSILCSESRKAIESKLQSTGAKNIVVNEVEMGTIVCITASK